MAWRWALCGVGLSAASSIAVAACAQGQDGIDLGSGGVTDPDGGSGPDARVPPRDASGGVDSSSPDSSSSPDECPSPAGCTGKVVINELQANGPSNAEFVELFNPNDCAVSLGGWKLLYRSSGDNPGGTLYVFEAGDSIAAGELLLLGNNDFQAPKQGTLGSASMGNGGGQVGLVDDANKLVDAVGYSSGTAGQYTEKTFAPSPETGSIGRKCGVDTDNNGADFKAYAQHSAGAPNP